MDLRTGVTHSTSLNCKRRFITSTNCVLSAYISHEHMVRPRSSRHSSRYRQSRVTHHSHACHTLYTGIWHPMQIFQGQMTSSPTWQRRDKALYQDHQTHSLIFDYNIRGQRVNVRFRCLSMVSAIVLFPLHKNVCS